MTIQLDLPLVPDGALRGERTPIKQRNPSARHQALLELVKMFPATLLSLVEPDLQIGYPIQGPLTARVSDCDAYGLRIDTRLDYFQPGDAYPVLAIVVEVQLDREDDLRWRLCPYVGFTSHDARCATDIVVLCGNRSLAKSLARPMLMGARGSNITPLPIGPGEVPVIGNLEEAMADPGLLMLSGWHHAEDSDETRELLVGLIVEVLQWLEAVDKEKARQYYRLAGPSCPCHPRGGSKKCRQQRSRSSWPMSSTRSGPVKDESRTFSMSWKREKSPFPTTSVRSSWIARIRGG